MKRLQSFIIGIIAIALFDGCIKNELTVFTAGVVEFDAASWNANGAGLTYPILTRIPGYGRVANTSDPLLTRTNTGIKKFRINLVGQQLTTDTDVFVVLGSGTTAQVDRHFRIKTPVRIPAKSSFGELEVEILNPGTASSTPVDLNLTLSGGSGTVKVSENYKTIGLRISQL
ncbi:MAG: hypothetical protein RLZZ420_1054 [Bacteroidota bacterium]|jgi:hypothetical protein